MGGYLPVLHCTVQLTFPLALKQESGHEPSFTENEGRLEHTACTKADSTSHQQPAKQLASLATEQQRTLLYAIPTTPG
jgi:hypothetical protein